VLAKFVVVGGSSWIVDTGVFTLLSHTVLDGKPVTSKLISVLLSTILNYILNREWSFNGRGGRERHHEAMLFFLFNAIALGLNLLPLWISRYLLEFNPAHHTRFGVTVADFIAANLIGTLIAMAFRYWAYRRWVFPEELTSEQGLPSRGAELDSSR